MSKLPAFQFYPGDWMKDPALRSCASAARGLWMDMLCLMSEVGHRGYLQTPAGKPVSVEQLARMVGNTPAEVRDLLTELEDAGVFSRTAEGVIYSRRMARDEEKRKKAKEFGQRGGNPSLRAGGGVNGGVNPPQVSGAKKRTKPNLTPSSSSSSSPSGGEETPSGVPSLAAEEKPARKRDELFDAIAEVTGSDAKASGKHIGPVAAELRKADPPYTAEEVRLFAEQVAAGAACPWATRDGRTRPTLGEVGKYIGHVRNGPPPATGPPPSRNRFRTHDEQVLDVMFPEAGEETLT